MEVARELNNIDVLLVSERERFVCLIENKLDTREGADQLQRYKEYVRLWYPGFRTVLVYFTLRGDAASDREYASMSYSDFIPSVERYAVTLVTRTLAPNEDVQLLISHYRDLLNRRLMIRRKTLVELPPETSAICNNLFVSDYVATTRYVNEVKAWQAEVQKEMERFIGDMIREEFGADCFRPGPFKRPFDVYLPFVPQALDSIASLKAAGADPAYQGQVFDFVFQNIPFEDPFRNKEPGIHLFAALKAARPDHSELREIIYQSAKENRALFNLASSKTVGDAKRKCGLLSRTLCTADDFLRHPLGSVKLKLPKKFRRFVQHQYPIILQVLSQPAVQKYAVSNRYSPPNPDHNPV